MKVVDAQTVEVTAQIVDERRIEAMRVLVADPCFAVTPDGATCRTLFDAVFIQWNQFVRIRNTQPDLVLIRFTSERQV